jgi:hypothetical protein
MYGPIVAKSCLKHCGYTVRTSAGFDVAVQTGKLLYLTKLLLSFICLFSIDEDVKLLFYKTIS